MNKGIVRRYYTVIEVVHTVRCFGWAWVYRDKDEFVVAETGGDHGDLIGIFTADFAARHGEWVLAQRIMDAMG